MQGKLNTDPVTRVEPDGHKTARFKLVAIRFGPFTPLTPSNFPLSPAQLALAVQQRRRPRPHPPDELRRLSGCGPQFPEQLHLRIACLFQFQSSVTLFMGDLLSGPVPAAKRESSRQEHWSRRPGDAPGIQWKAAAGITLEYNPRN